MTRNIFPFGTLIQRDKFFKMKFEEGDYEKTKKGASSFQIRLENEYPGITRFVEMKDAGGRDIYDIIMDIYGIEYE